MGSGTQDLVPQSVHMTVLLASEDLGFQSPNSAARIEAHLSFLEFFKNMEGFSIVHSLKEQGVATGYAVHKTDLDPVAESITKDRKLVTRHVSIIAAQEDALLAENPGDSASGYNSVTYPHLRIEVRNALSPFVRQTMACALLSYGLSRGWERFAYKGARALKKLSDQDFADLVSGRRYDATIQRLAPALGTREPFLNWAAFYGLEEPTQIKVNTASRKYFTAIVKPAAQGWASDGQQAAAAKRWATESELLEPATEALFWPKTPREAPPTP